MPRGQSNELQTTYEAAAKLRDHGYPQPTHNAKSPEGIFYSEPSQAYGPSFAELFRSLGAMRELEIVTRVGPERWLARSNSGKRMSGSTAAEALANLWCVLNKRNRGRKNNKT